MLREGFSPDARHVMVIVSAAKGVAMQYRSATGGTSASVAIHPGTAPRWVRLARRGNAFTGYTSTDGATWTTIGTITIPMAPEVSAALVVTSHNTAVRTTAVLDEASITRP